MDTLRITQKQNYAIIQLHRGKVNAINAQMVREIRETFRTMAADDQVGGVILTGTPHFFSAGLDVIELYQYDRETIRSFFTAFGQMYHELLQFPKPLVCAVTGHSPAGGTVLAITADYRVMAEGDRYRIGLNEMAVNVQISQKLVEGYAYWIGTGLANEYILDGKLLSVSEAKQAGLVNEVAPLEEVLTRAEQKMQHYLMADPNIFRNTKAKLRKQLWANLDADSEAELEQSQEIWWKPEVRQRMKLLVDSLTKK